MVRLRVMISKQKDLTAGNVIFLSKVLNTGNVAWEEEAVATAAGEWGGEQGIGGCSGDIG